MAKLFGFEITRAKEKKSTLTTTPIQDDTKHGAIEAEVVQRDAIVGKHAIHELGYDTHLADSSGIAYVNTYRRMAEYPEIHSAVDDIVNEAIILDHPSNEFVKINLEHVKDASVTTEIKKDIEREFNFILNSLNFEQRGYDIFRQFYVDGRLFYHLKIDESKPEEGIKEMVLVDPRKIIKVIVKIVEREGETTIVKEERTYFLYNPAGLTSSQLKNAANGRYNYSDVVGSDSFISEDSVVYITSGKLSTDNKHVVGYLHGAIQTWNHLRYLEGSAVMYYVSRAPERRIFYIDVGNLPDDRAEKLVSDQMSQYKTDMTYDPNTGQIRSEVRQLSMREDWWLPRRNGSGGTEVETLDSSELSDMEENLRYFQRKLFRSLNVPFARIDVEQEGGGEVQVGPTDDIFREEIRYARYIARLRNKFSELFTHLLERQLVLKKVFADVEEWRKIASMIRYDFITDNHYTELNRMGVLLHKAEAAGDFEDVVGTYVSHGFIQRNVFGFTKKEIKDMEKEIEAEKEHPIFGGSDDEDSGGGRGRF